MKEKSVFQNNFTIYMNVFQLKVEDIAQLSGICETTLMKMWDGEKIPSKIDLHNIRDAIYEKIKVHIPIDLEKEYLSVNKVSEQIENERKKHSSGVIFVPENKLEDITEEHKNSINKAFVHAVEERMSILYELFMENVVKDCSPYFIYKIENQYFLVKGRKSGYLLYAYANECEYLGCSETDIYIQVDECIKRGMNRVSQEAAFCKYAF